jgi:hypothetical protein
MIKSAISIPAKWEPYLKQLADDHQVDLNSVISELCAWTFSNSENKKQFEAWLDGVPPKGEDEDKARSANEEISENEEEKEEESEEEAHEDRDYSEDREIKP